MSVPRQSIEPGRRRARPLYIALVVVALAWQFRGVLGGGVFAFEDVTAYFVPLYSALGRALRHHGLPFWEIGAWSGQPLLGDPQVGVFYPPHWLCAWVAPIRLYAWLTVGHAGLGAAGMWRLVRARQGSVEAAALAAIALASSAFYVLEVRHAMFGASTAWLVWSLWALERWGQERRVGSLLLLAAFAALSLLAGGWSLLYYGAAVAAVLAVASALRSRSARSLVQIGGAALLGLALAAVALGPALMHARYSPRSLGLTYSEAASYAWPSWRYVVTLVLPTFFGDGARGTYVGAPDQWELSGWSVGLTAVLFVPWALTRRDRRGERIALLFLCGAAIGLARGCGFFLHPFLYRHWPLFTSLRCPARALYVWTLVIPILAGDGLDEAITWLRRVRLPQLAPLLLFVPAVAAAELAFTWRAENPTVDATGAAATIPAIEALRHHTLLGRATNEVHLPQSFHNAGMRWGYESAGGYSSVPIWRYLHYLYIANHGHVYPSAHLDRDLTAQGLWRFSSPLVDLLGVRWVLSDRAHPIDAQAKGYQRVFAGDDGVDLWRSDHAMPRAFAVYRIEVAADADAAAAAIADPAFAPDRVAVVEEPLPSIPRADAAATDAPPMTPASGFFRIGPTDLTIELTATAPAVLVIGDAYYPNWTATVDDVDVPLLKVDYALRGVALTKGTHVVSMTYLDLTMAYGAAMSVTALALLLLLGLRQRWLRQVGDKESSSSGPAETLG